MRRAGPVVLNSIRPRVSWTSLKLLTGLFFGFALGILATVGFLEMRTGQLPSANPAHAASP
jgi:hypothetical protein